MAVNALGASHLIRRNVLVNFQQAIISGGESFVSRNTIYLVKVNGIVDVGGLGSRISANRVFGSNRDRIAANTPHTIIESNTITNTDEFAVVCVLGLVSAVRFNRAVTIGASEPFDACLDLGGNVEY